MLKQMLAVATVGALLALSGCAAQQDGGQNYAIEYAQPPLTPEPTVQDIAITEATKAKYKTVTPDEAQKLIDSAAKGALKLIDVRDTGAFMPAHIQGALSVPDVAIGASPVDALPDVNVTLIVYGADAAQSKDAALKLIQAGYTNVLDMGAIDGWKSELVSG